MNKYNIDYLKNINSHTRDSNIVFYEPTHKYTVLNDPNSKYTSVTTWNHSHFEHFDADKIIKKMMSSNSWKVGHKYYGKTPIQIKRLWDDNRDSAAKHGTQIHYLIECFMNLAQFIVMDNDNYSHNQHSLLDLFCFYNENNSLLDICHDSNYSIDLEFKYFLNFVQAYPDLIPYRTEWVIYDDDLKLSGSIDMLFTDKNGKFHIYDWKRSKDIVKSNSWFKFSHNDDLSHIPDTNYWHYCLQLNTYKAILERKYNIIIDSMFLVCLHPDNKNNNFLLFKVADLQKELNSLFNKINTFNC